ncbi:MAG: methyltransferase domain-containing protein, partial [Nitrososphaerales archaeon]
HNGHLETPWFYASERGSSDRLAILEEMLERVPQIAKGVNVFRQIPDLVAPGSHERLLPLTRGGNTLVLDVGCLRDYPNIAPQVGGLRFRRGDTLWTILNGVTGTGKAPRKVVPTNLSVRQDRRYCQSSIFDTQSLLTDIMGGAFTRTMNEILKKSLSKKGNPDAPLRFTSGDIADFVRAFDGRLRERFSLLTLNSWRIVGLVGSIRTQIREIVREGSAELAVFRRHEREIDDFLSSVEAVFSPQAIKKLRTEALEYPRAQLEHFLQELEGNCASYRDQLPPPNSPVDINHTISFLHGHFNNRRFKLLAEAGEGFVLTDGEFAYKYFYHGVYNFHEGQLDFVRNACSIQRLHWAKHIVPIEESLLDGSQVVFVSRLVRGQRYHGGRLSEILELLRECRRARIVLTNISPENIVVTRERLAHVDIGRSVEPFDEHGYREMCRRAFLVYKWHFRSDIKELLTRAMDDDSLPELIGFEQFLVALEEKGVHDVMDDTLLEAVSRDRPSRVLDYGCGNGVVADKMAHWGLELTTFDIDRGRYDDHWHSDNVKFVHRDRLDELKRSLSLFDVVLCNLVLCSVEDSETVAQILKDLRSLVDHNGSVILGICNPFGLETEESETEIKKVPKGRRYSEHFSYQKSMKVSRGVRTDFHRPFSWYKMMLRRAGLNISELIEVPGTDVPRLTPGSDFLVLRLKPAPIPSRSNVSLLIKASAMEWRTIEKQVTHLVNQLEVPRLFLEKVVVIDNN